jgi:TatD DNase family protein
MELIDSHCHLYVSAFSEDIDSVIQRAQAAGVTRFYLPAIDRDNEDALLQLEARYPGICFAMQGLHPCSVKADWEEALGHIDKTLGERGFAAIGETGLDFYWDRSFEEQQYQAFRRQIELALHYDLPVVIHSRNSIEQSLSVIGEYQRGNLRGIFHCFNEDEESARKIVGLGFYMGIGGTVTYKNSKLPTVIKSVGLQNIVLETDAPYLPPVPFRGKRNESSFIVHVADKLAEIMGVTPEEVAGMTTANALTLFRDENGKP